MNKWQWTLVIAGLLAVGVPTANWVRWNMYTPLPHQRAAAVEKLDISDALKCSGSEGAVSFDEAVLCCCATNGGGQCCGETRFCGGGYVPGCACRIGG